MVCESIDTLAHAVFYRTHDAFNALSYLLQQSYVDSRNVFLMGQSNGGSAALVAAGGGYEPHQSQRQFTAVVAFYPWCGALPHSLVSPVLVLGAEFDDWVPPVACESAHSRDLGKPYDVIVYRDAHHSFDLNISVTSYKGHTVGGNDSARRDSQIQMLQWFEKFRE